MTIPPSPRGAIPWGRPRHELLLLALVALVALSPVYPQDPQDTARICLARALAHGRLHDDVCLSDAFDRARYGGHLYSDKAPGLAALELPFEEAFGIGGKPWTWPSVDFRLWGVRLLTAGALFLACAFLFGRVSEGLAPGYGAGALVAFALGTLVAPLAATGFAHVPSAALLFGSFVLAWRRRALAAGLAAGAAVLADYQAELAVAIVGVYLAVRGRRLLARYAAGVVPGVAVLGLYDWAAFGRPWHLSYRYVDNVYARDQASGVFGIGAPHLFQAVEVFAGPGGILVVAPVLLLAAFGLYELRRDYPAEAATCAAVTVAFVFLNCGYFLPYGGVSPGPRFLVPSLPFLALGIAPAFRRLPRTTAAATVVSVASVTALALVWASNRPLRETVWGELARVPFQLGSSRYAKSLTPTFLHAAGLGRGAGAALVGVCAAAALAVALRSTPLRAAERARRPRAALATAAACVCLVAVADVGAALAYPYGNRTAGAAISIADLATTIAIVPGAAVYVGGYVNFVVTVDYGGNETARDLVLTLRLSPGLRLAGPPAYTIGSGCTGTSTVACRLDYLPAGQSTQVRFGVQITEHARQTVTAAATTNGVPGLGTARITLPVH